MKDGIHPKYYTEARIVCACGNILVTGSTRPELHVEVCSNCHPFYTGKTNLVDTAGTVEKFRKRSEKSAQIAAARPARKPRTKKAKPAKINLK